MESQIIKRRKTNWIGHILHRNCLQKQVVERKIEGRRDVTGSRGRTRKLLLDDLKEKRGNTRSYSVDNSL